MRLPVILVLPVLLAACGGAGPAVSVAVIAADGASYILTGKNVTDHAYSAVVDKDCAMWRMLKDEPACKDVASSDGVAIAESASVHVDPFVYDVPPRPEETDRPAGYGPGADSPRPATRPKPAENYLVLGTYVDRAASQRALVRARKFLPVITRLEDGEKPVYRVVVGPYAPQHAETMRRRLASAGFKDVWPISLCPDTFRTPPCRAASQGVAVADLPRSARRFLRR